MPRDNFSQATKDNLAKKAGLRCSNPGCRNATTGSSLGNGNNKRDITCIGEAAHICAASKGGPRYDQNMTSDQRSSESNGIWLCANCATLIDREPNKYSKEVLYQWKGEAEQEWANNLGKGISNNISATKRDLGTLADIRKYCNFQQILSDLDAPLWRLPSDISDIIDLYNLYLLKNTPTYYPFDDKVLSSIIEKIYDATIGLTPYIHRYYESDGYWLNYNNKLEGEEKIKSLVKNLYDAIYEWLDYCRKHYSYE